jgi:serine/threonine protein kinase
MTFEIMFTPDMRSEIASMQRIAHHYGNDTAASDAGGTKIKNFILITTNMSDEPSHENFDKYAHLIYMTFFYQKQTRVFPTLKSYLTKIQTGVFQSDQHIIKYEQYDDLRQLRVYKILGHGINYNFKIVAPIWYHIYEHICSSTAATKRSASIEAAVAADFGGGPDANSTLGKIDNLMTLEIQPRLKYSTMFYKWYRTSHIAMRDHDYIIATMMLSVAKSIAYCHDKLLVHGDIKPDNFLVISIPTPTIRRDTVPDIFLIDFGMCGREDRDDGSGGTRPFCAPETTNIRETDIKIVAHDDNDSRSSDNYRWCKQSRKHDVWSFGLILFTLISYRKVFHYYSEYPAKTFDQMGYVNECELSGDPEINSHALYPVFSKTLCVPENRASIGEVVQLLTDALNGGKL